MFPGTASEPALRCSQCGQCFGITRPVPWCDCGGLFDLAVEPSSFDVDSGEFSMWRYQSMLPIRNRVSLGEPITPISTIRLADRTVDAKFDFLFPTGSFKDRGAAVFVAALQAAGVGRFIEDSSGNAGASMATYAARAGIECEIYCPASASGPKLAQVERAGAIIHRIEGPRQRATDAVRKRVGTTFYASHNWHPLFLHGTKTLAYEIAEQHGWNPPAHIVSPAGGGAVILGLELGFSELHRLGRIQNVPALYAVQAEACAPLVQGQVEPGRSLAEGILSPNAPRLERLRKAIAGASMVSESEIEEGFRALASQGVHVEPTTAVLYSGVGKLDIPADETILVILTGSGLKFQPAPLKP
jgi:threonine synthase